MSKNKYIIKLLDPYNFEGQEIKEIDLSRITELTCKDLCLIDDKMLQEGYSGQTIELTKRYAALTAARVMLKPWEFCDNMKARDVIRLKNFVTSFFYTRAALEGQTEAN